MGSLNDDSLLPLPEEDGGHGVEVRLALEVEAWLEDSE